MSLYLITFIVGFCSGLLGSLASMWWRAKLDAKYGRRYIRHPQRKPKPSHGKPADVSGGSLMLDTVGPAETPRPAQRVNDPAPRRPAIGFAPPAVPPSHTDPRD